MSLEEQIKVNRAKELVQNGEELFASSSLMYFLKNKIGFEDFTSDNETLERFADLDDYDIWGAIKVWQGSDDIILRELSQRLIDRELFKIEVSKNPFSEERIKEVTESVMNALQLNEEQAKYFVYSNRLTNNAYNEDKQNINLLFKDGTTMDVSKASDNLNISALSKPVEKYFLSYPIF